MRLTSALFSARNIGERLSRSSGRVPVSSMFIPSVPDGAPAFDYSRWEEWEINNALVTTLS